MVDPNLIKANNASMWGAIGGLVTSTFQYGMDNLNPKVREHQLKLQESKEREAQANASNQTAKSFDPKYLVIAAVVIVVALVVLKISKK